MSASIDIQKFILALQKDIRPRAIRAAKNAMAIEAERVLGEAQQLAPVSPSNKKIPGIRKKWIKNPAWTGHSGDLKDSATREDVQENNAFITCRIGFNVPYAAVQHERLDYQHTQGQAKYLETALRANQSGLADRLAAAIKQEIEK